MKSQQLSNSKQIILSILIPTYNRQKALKNTIENFVNQIIENNLENKIELIYTIQNILTKKLQN